ncbi:cyclophane-containing peptide 2OG-Fe(II) oxygenase YhhC [Sphingomonas sp. CLY1604]|uniref:cyclophane-containing peptide 2OG-Fe(II) oxygenase YhhC n=1 Tax=Sphingomonas sp. CLY1604 TaxID=3457786 RepID=UPI003FD77241
MLPDFTRTVVRSVPFANFRSADVIDEAASVAMLDWLDEAPWKLRVEDFYEQHEFSLLGCQPPGELAFLASERFVSAVARELSDRLGAPALSLVDVTVHRLVPGQTIRIHNDEIGGEETHRLLIQLNRGWSFEQGGLLMLFADDDPASVTDVIVPDHRSAFGFEISARSHHAVSTIRSGNRDTIVYTFKAVS